MKYLLDTCVLSESFRPRPAEKVALWMRKLESTPAYLSVLSLGEFQKGISKLKATDEPRSARISEHLHGSIIRHYRDRILPLDLEVVLKWGEIAGGLAAKGEVIPVADGLIAATARVHGLVLVTRNEKEFQGAGIEILNPWN